MSQVLCHLGNAFVFVVQPVWWPLNKEQCVAKGGGGELDTPRNTFFHYVTVSQVWRAESIFNWLPPQAALADLVDKNKHHPACSEQLKCHCNTCALNVKGTNCCPVLVSCSLSRSEFWWPALLARSPIPCCSALPRVMSLAKIRYRRAVFRLRVTHSHAVPLSDHGPVWERHTWDSDRLQMMALNLSELLQVIWVTPNRCFHW